MVTVFFASNRDLVGTRANPDFGSRFNRDGPMALRFGYADVPEAAFTDEAQQAGIRIYLAPESIRSARQKLGSREIFSIVRSKMQKHGRDTVVFLHGYANTFRNALTHAALLKTIYKEAPFNIFVFSWPSNGEMIPYMSYYSDRSDARASGNAMARAFMILRDFLDDPELGEFCNQRLHLMAHSMGNYALRNAVQGLRQEFKDSIPRMFDNVFLFAADEDEDAFEHDDKFRLLPALGRLVNVYFNADDRALWISDATKANPDRLGTAGPRLIDNLPRKLVLLNCRDVAGVDPRDTNGHDYHRYAPEAIRDIDAVLAGKPPEQFPWRRYVDIERSYRILAA